MWALYLAAAILVQGQQDKWISFEICAVDKRQLPYRAYPSKDHGEFHIRADKIGAVTAITPRPQGIECCAIATEGGHTIFVIGSCNDVLRKIRE